MDQCGTGMGKLRRTRSETYNNTSFSEAIRVRMVTLQDRTVMEDALQLTKADAMWFALINAVKELADRNEKLAAYVGGQQEMIKQLTIDNEELRMENKELDVKVNEINNKLQELSDLKTELDQIKAILNN